VGLFARGNEGNGFWQTLVQLDIHPDVNNNNFGVPQRFKREVVQALQWAAARGPVITNAFYSGNATIAAAHSEGSS